MPSAPSTPAEPVAAVAAVAAVDIAEDDEPPPDEGTGNRTRKASTSAVGPFPASVDAGQTESLRSRTGGRVKTALADGAAIQKGTIIVTFESGADASELATLQDRIASLENVEGEEAKRDLKQARQKLAALEGGQNAPPVTSSMDGVLTGFAVVPGAVVRAGEVIGKVVDGAVASRVRVTVVRATRPKAGQKVMMNLKSGGSLSGTVVAVSGRSVIVDPGSEPAENVESVGF
jgi:biotin carboxyl carrier protein